MTLRLLAGGQQWRPVSLPVDHAETATVHGERIHQGALFDIIVAVAT
jgi:hypothetical protein